jgi:hypothetical protein
MRKVIVEIYTPADKLPEMFPFGDKNEHLISNMLYLFLKNSDRCKGKYLKFAEGKAHFTGVDFGNVSEVDVVEWCELPA